LHVVLFHDSILKVGNMRTLEPQKLLLCYYSVAEPEKLEVANEITLRTKQSKPKTVSGVGLMKLVEFSGAGT